MINCERIKNLSRACLHCRKVFGLDKCATTFIGGMLKQTPSIKLDPDTTTKERDP